MDTLGIDEDRCPVIIEYKRDRNENVINQGLYYLDWLMDHRANFEVLVRDRLDRVTADNIEWSAPRVICIASDFTKFDLHAVKQMGRNIELIRYRKFGDGLLLLDQLTSVSGQLNLQQRIQTNPNPNPTNDPAVAKQIKYKTAAEFLQDATPALSALFEDVRIALLALGDGIQEKQLRFYFAFRRIKNFACVEVKPTLGLVRVYLKIDPDTVELADGFLRDVRDVGHFGTGDLEVSISTHEQLHQVKHLFAKSYEQS